MGPKIVCRLPKNLRETYCFRLGEYKGHRFIDMRVFVAGDGQNHLPTRKGITIAPHLWPQFRQALAQVDEALLEAGWLDREDLADGEAK